MNYAKYILDYMPHRTIPNMTLVEALTHVKPDACSFKLFGSQVWEPIPNERHKAMENVDLSTLGRAFALPASSIIYHFNFHCLKCSYL